LALLGVFFILNGMNGYTDLIRPLEPIILSVILIILSVLCLAFSRLLFKNRLRSNTFSVFVLLVVLFARTNLLSVKELIDPGFRTSAYLISLSAGLAIIGWAIQKSAIPKLERFQGFLILLFSSLIVYETGRLVLIKPLVSFRQKDQVKPSTWPVGPKENIYVLLFDEYQGSQGLLKLTGYANEHVEKFLKYRGFTVAVNPRSTYRITFYALPSLFSMDTLVFTRNDTRESLRLGIMADKILDRSNTFTNFLRTNGYSIVNCSMFRIGGTERVQSIPIGLSWLELQLLKTFPWWARYDMMHYIPSNRIQKFLGTYYAKFVRYNHVVHAKTLESVQPRTDTPRFVFSHFLLPHNPLVFDSAGNERSFRETHAALNPGNSKVKQDYVDQLIYANRIIESIVRQIDHMDPNASVIILSDHGSRNLADETPDVFNILWAMRVKGGPAVVAEKDIEMVNTFRILLNNVAGQELPMLSSTPKY
jgi:hypothetical protein